MSIVDDPDAPDPAVPRMGRIGRTSMLPTRAGGILMADGRPAAPRAASAGGCVRYELGCAPGPIDICYCQMCRKASGSPLATNAAVAAAAFTVTRGKELLAAYQSSPGE